ncbi:MAG TPA: sugar phosphate isomerase/epimerase [Syntrophobacteraceae bacterium]|nr:sugar phosphate isomerase/epimerase [Syntrophobacteraceae bacterium]
MTFGYSTNAFTRHDLYTALEMIANLGFEGVEIMCDQPHLYPPEWHPDQVKELKTALQRLNLKVTNLNSFTLYAVGDVILPSWIDDDPMMRQTRIDHTKSCLHLAATLGCGNISIPPGGRGGLLPEEDAFALFRVGLEQVVPVAEDLGIRLLIEPEPLLLIETSRQFEAFIHGFESEYLGCNFDIGHFYCAGEDPAEVFERLAPWVGHVHVEDIALNRVHEHLIPGLGAVDFDAVFERMARAGYRGDISLELYPYVDRPIEAGRLGRQHLLPILDRNGLVNARLKA